MIPSSQIAKAKNADLPSVLCSLGLELCREGRGFFVKSHDSLKLFQKRGIWLYKWWSRNGEIGDGIQFLQRYYGMKFQDAVQALSGTPCDHIKCECESHPPNGHQENCLSNIWRDKTKKLIDFAISNIFSISGAGSLSYLIHERGLTRQTIRDRNLGWLPAKDHMPDKLVIPCYDSKNRLIRIRFRIDKPGSEETRYRVMKGSNTHSFFPLGFSFRKPLIWVESELDAILLHQEAGNFAGVIALGSAANNIPEPVRQFLLRNVPANLICLDNDECGKRRTRYFLNRIPNAFAWTVPKIFGKDPGEAWKFMNLNEWVIEGLNRGLDKVR